MNRRALITRLAGGVAIAGVGGSGALSRNLPRYNVDALAIGGPGSVDGPEVLAAGMDAQVLDMTIFPRAYGPALEALTAWNVHVEAPETSIRIVRDGGDFQLARDAGQLAVVIACQDASILGPAVISYSDQNLENLRTLHGLGLRVLQLTHNERTAAGDGFMEPNDGGLSLLGGAIVEEMGRLGGLIDLSHCSDRTTLEAIEVSTRPLAISHSGCRTLHSSRRNKTDEAIRALADKGGFFGVFMMSRWLTDRETSSAEDVVDHIAHAVRVGGIEAVGFGSDQPAMGDDSSQEDKVARLAAYQARNLGRPGAEPLHGHVTCADMDGPDRMVVLARALERRGFRSADVDRIVGGNFVRIFGDATVQV